MTAIHDLSSGRTQSTPIRETRLEPRLWCRSHQLLRSACSVTSRNGLPTNVRDTFLSRRMGKKAQRSATKVRPGRRRSRGAAAASPAATARSARPTAAKSEATPPRNGASAGARAPSGSALDASAATTRRFARRGSTVVAGPVLHLQDASPMNSNERVRLVLELLDGNVTAAELAHRNGLTEQELLAWRDTWLAGARAATKTSSG